MKLIIRAVCALALLLPLAAQALTQDITAVFRPDPSNPTLKEFVNTTEQSGICAWHIPARCKAMGIFTIRTNDLTATSIAPILANHVNPRQGAMWKLPSEWRDVQVTHQDTGVAEVVQMRIAGIGHRADTRPDTYAWTQEGKLDWYRQWYYAPSPCEGINWLSPSSAYFLFFWLVPENAGVCNRAPGTDVTLFMYRMTEYAYALRTPNPMTMASGVYTGSLTYTVGPNGDFDFGDVMIPNDTLFTFNFTLNVDHHLKVEVPPGGNRVQLEPQEGWQAWLKNGRKPTRLFRDQTVNLWASSPFKMTLECGEPMGNTCSMRNAAGHQVPLDVAVTLPVGLNDSVGRPVNRLPLRLDGVGTQLFQPTRYIARKPSTLHFEIKADSVSQMLDHGGGSAYSGTATVVWDSGL
ncbi:hypothetical protein ACQRBV_03565 [Pseudomonas sp. R11F]|uniref:hypothetical protein n=1 Tax=Pseudomonas TaxID=286 RepID=UPI00398E3908